MEIYDVAIIPLIVGIVELFKGIGLPRKFGALVAAVIGILIGIFYLEPGDVPKGILIGLSLGLAASGLYSGTRNTTDATRTIVKSLRRRL